VTFEGVKAL